MSTQAERKYDKSMSRPTDEQILLQMYTAWKAVTVLEDKSYYRFTGIVMQCMSASREQIRSAQDIDKTSATCSTGSVHVVCRISREGEYSYEVMITPTYTIHHRNGGGVSHETQRLPRNQRCM